MQPVRRSLVCKCRDVGSARPRSQRRRLAKPFTTNHPTHPRAFTLVEMLVVITILIIILTLTVTLVNVSNQSEPIRSSARQVQSYLEGARNRAVYANQPRGVRLIRDETDPNTAVGMVFIGPPERINGTVSVLASANPAMVGRKFKQGADETIRWSDLVTRGLLKVGTRIQIPADTGVKYPVTGINLDVITIARQHFDFRSNSDTQGQSVSYKLDLEPAVLAGEEAVLFSKRILIDIAHSKKPDAWNNQDTNMDILFSPRGMVIGPTAAEGVIHFLLADLVDTSQGYNATNANNEGQKLVVTLFTRTGHITRNVVNPSDVFSYAIAGEDSP